jgi:UDP-N-acetylglucosamine:LPS N-acetylglucosamine transferase
VTAPRVVVPGGHSAGHIEPAMNFADALRRLEPTAQVTALGVANRLAARMTTHVFTATPGIRLAHDTAIGIPLRPAITTLDRPALRDAARQRFGLRPGGLVLMVTGGSQGAGAINAAVSGAAAALRAAGVQVLHITGRQHVVEVPERDPTDPPYVVIPYIDEMQYAYAAADFVICRSGAMTWPNWPPSAYRPRMSRCRCEAVSNG